MNSSCATLCVAAATLLFFVVEMSAVNIDGYASSSDCSSSTDPVRGRFSMYPTGPNSLVAYGEATVDEELTSPLKATLKVQKKVLWWWVTAKSLSYDDVCQFLQPTNATQSNSCPPTLQNLPSCNCPLQQGTYSVQETTFDTSSIEISGPSWLVSGSYYAKAVLSTGGRQLACNEIYFGL
ncbi:ganglioside GM2 activator-like [Acanthaster planci]|uniref:Ganglioside GM2 activator-like n=1 Tax=Acanthaster planci TaxID=133434 RepID=A0A8B7Y4Q0_ACAPL|nr:ganglioside GM2 activator-like [Acanthaster planci]